MADKRLLRALGSELIFLINDIVAYKTFDRRHLQERGNLQGVPILWRELHRYGTALGVEIVSIQETFSEVQSCHFGI